MKRIVVATLILLSLGSAKGEDVGNPILFVTQFPIAADFGTIGSTFGNHMGTISSVGRGGDLYIRYTDGTLRNLTREAGYGNTGLQAENAIAVRDPNVHWSGNRALFSMVIGAPPRYQHISYYWQIYEITGFAQGDTVSITKLPNQPATYNNITPIYGSDGSVIFTSDMPRTKNRFNYPQRDEYESFETNTGLWKLDIPSGQVSLLQHSPSGSFSPLVDSAGRIVFTRWDHLQQDQQRAGSFGAFNYSSENPDAQAINTNTEVFPESRYAEGKFNGHRINHFFPWQLNQDGTEEETLNHVGRHELHDYFNRSINNDGNLSEFISNNPGNIFNFFQLAEDPSQAGRFIGIDAPEFGTHAAGQIIAISLPVGARPDLVTTEHLTNEESQFVVADGDSAPPGHLGFSRDPVILEAGTILASHTSETRAAGNDGTRSNPDPRYDFRLKTYSYHENHWRPNENLISLSNTVISYYDPDTLVTYDGPLWELQAREVISRPKPPMTTEKLQSPELQVLAEENVDVVAFKAFLEEQNLAVVVMRDLTTRDEADIQQPFNLKVTGSSHQTTGNEALLYEISHVQFFQGDQIRGYGGVSDPEPGQRIIAQIQHDANSTANNIVFQNAPGGSTKIFADGSASFFVPARRAMTWQSLDPSGTPVVRERYWITFQPGEIRACGGCHGVNHTDQSGAPATENKAEAFRALLQHWQQGTSDPIYCDSNTVSNRSESSAVFYEACETLVVGPSFTAEQGASVNLSSGRNIKIMPGFKVELGATLGTEICGQSLCEASFLPMPNGCHSCVVKICDIDPSCCDTAFDQSCLTKVNTVCGLVCESP